MPTASQLCQFFESLDDEIDAVVIARNVAIILNLHADDELDDEEFLIKLFNNIGHRYEALADQVKSFEMESNRLVGEATMLDSLLEDEMFVVNNLDELNRQHHNLAIKTSKFLESAVHQLNEIVAMFH